MALTVEQVDALITKINVTIALHESGSGKSYKGVYAMSDAFKEYKDLIDYVVLLGEEK